MTFTDARPILTFHTIEDTPDAISFPSHAFERALARLRDWGYGTLTLCEFAARTQLPARSLVLTFDDGYRSVYDCAFPVLQRHQMTATIFLLTRETRGAYLGREMLSWDEIREMQKYGIEFGAHTLTHPDLTRISLNDAEREMRVSKEIIEQKLGTAVTSFAYPFGRHNARVRKMARGIFTCAVTDRLGLTHPGSDRYALARVETYYVRGARRFGLIATPFFETYLHAVSIPRELRRVLSFR